jgi:ABC-2 type transport system permease protein
MSAFAQGLTAQLRLLAGRWSYRLLFLLFLGAAALSAATYRQGAMRGLPVAVYDADGTGLSRTVLRAIDATPELRVVTDPPPTLDQAEAALVRGDLAAVVLLPDGFSAALKRGRQAEVVVAADLSNVLTGKTAQRAVARVLATVAAGVEVSVLGKLGLPPTSALARALPITATEALPDNPGASYAPYAAPPFAYSYVHVLVLFLAWSVLWRQGAARRPTEQLGRFAACAGVGLLAGLLVTYGVLALDGLSAASGLPVMLLLLAALVVADLLFAAALSTLFRGGLLGFQTTVLLGMLSLMLSGLTWPWDAIPAPLRAVAAAIPFTPFGQAVRLAFPARVGPAALSGPLGWMGLQAAGYLAVLAAAALAGRLAALVRKARAPGPPAPEVRP